MYLNILLKIYPIYCSCIFTLAVIKVMTRFVLTKLLKVKEHVFVYLYLL